MGKKKSDDFDLGSIGEALGNLQDAYASGLEGMSEAENISSDSEPSHKVIVDVINSAKVEGKNYLVDAHLEFLVDLSSILSAQSGDIASLLGGLGVDLSEEESSQVVEQLSQPRCVGNLDNFKINKLELYSSEGKEKEGINKNGKVFITLNKNKLNISFESVFAFPEIQAKKTLYCAIPSQKKMQENIVFDVDKLKKVNFSWTEKDKDNLKIKGSAEIKKIK